MSGGREFQRIIITPAIITILLCTNHSGFTVAPCWLLGLLLGDHKLARSSHSDESKNYPSVPRVLTTVALSASTLPISRLRTGINMLACMLRG